MQLRVAKQRGMRLVRSALLVPVLLLAWLVPGPAAAQEPLLTRTGSGPVWTAATVTTDGSPLVSRLRVGRIALPLHLGVRLYDADRHLVSASDVTLRSPEEGVLLHAQPGAGLNVRIDERQRPDEAGGLRDVEGTLTVNGAGPVHVGTHTLVLWFASADVDRWTWTLDGDGLEVRGATSGDRVFLATSRDFASGTLNAAAGGHVAGSSAQARAQVGSSHRRTVRSTLLGAYYPVLSSADALRVHTPRGEQQCLPDCRFDQLDGPRAAGSGTYTFRLTGAGAGGVAGASAGDVVAVGAEVVLPGAAG